MLFQLQWHIEKALLDLSLRPGLSWTSPLSETEKMYSHIAIHTFITTVMKDNTLKNLAPLHALYFDVNHIRKSIRNIGFLPL